MQHLASVRRITLEDLGACADIDSHSHPKTAWTVQDFCNFLGWECNGGHVAVREGRIVGFLLYQGDRARRCLHLVRLAVLPVWRRRQIGSQLVQYIRERLQTFPDVKLWALVHERQLPVQCFLRANGFRAIRVCRGYHDDGQSDAYLFERMTMNDQP